MQTSPQIFSAAQWSQLNALLGTLNDSQRFWLSGYLAGSSQDQTGSTTVTAESGQKVLIAYGTETNNCRQLATDLAERCASAGIPAEVADLAGLRLRRLGKLEHLVVITATHGDGDPPEPILPFYEAIMAEDAARLAGLKFAVLALGDSSYEHFCVTGIELDQRLEALGDAVGILAENPPALVAMLLDATGLSGEQPVTLGQQALSLVEALRRHCDLCIPGKAFLELWAELTNDATLASVLNGDNKLLRQFLREHQIRDLISQFPAHPDAQALVDVLRPLQPRLYDVANSLSELPDELHLTVKAYDYAFGNREEAGICTRSASYD